MTTFAQILFSESNSNLSFEEFRQTLIRSGSMSQEIADREIINIPEQKKEITPNRVINRQAHILFREKLKGTTKLTEIIRFVVSKLNAAIEESETEMDWDLVESWEKKIQPALSTKTSQDKIKIFMEILSKLLILGGEGSKTLANYLRDFKSKKKEEEDENEDLSFISVEDKE